MKKHTYKLQYKKIKPLMLLYIMLVIVVFLITILLFFKSRNYVLKNSLIENITIEGTNTLVKHELLNMLTELKHHYLHNVDLYKIKDKIKSNSLIYEASVAKVYPNTIAIKVIENKPIFIWQNNNDEFFIVNSENRILRKAKIHEYKKLILVKGGNLAIKASEEIRFYVYSNKKLINRVKTISFNGYSWDLYLTNGIIIKLPEFNIGNAIKFLLTMDDKYQIFNRDICYIDARVPRKLFIKQRTT